MRITRSIEYLMSCLLCPSWLFVAACDEGNGGNGGEHEFLAPVAELHFETSSVEPDRTDLTIVLTSDPQVRDAYVQFLSGTAGPDPMDLIASSTAETLILMFPYINNRELITYNGEEHEGVVYFHHYLYVDGVHVTRENTVDEYIGDVTFHQLPGALHETASMTFSYHLPESTEKLFEMRVTAEVGYETHVTID